MNYKNIIRLLLRAFWEKKYESYLKKTRHDEYYISDEKFERIKEIASAAYKNKDTNAYSIYDGLDELVYMNCAGRAQMYFVMSERWYMILINHITYVEIFDFASETQICENIFKVINVLLELFSNKLFFGECFEDTSYPLMKIMEEKGKIKIHYDKMGMVWGYPVHNVYFSSTKKWRKRKKTNGVLLKLL